MKEGIQPTYLADAVIKCQNCGADFKFGGTHADVQVEICSQCHPFYTGKKVLIDTEGRVDKFKMKMQAASGRKKKVRKKTTLEDEVNAELADQIKKEKAKEEKEAAKKEAKAAAKVEEKVEEAEEAKEETAE